MQVAVEQAVFETALEYAEQKGLDQLGSVEALLADGGHVVDAYPGDPFHRQHPLAGQVPVHLRDPDVLAQRRGVHVRHPGVHRLGFQPEIELLGQVVGEVGHHVLRREPSAQLGQLHQLCAALEDLQIGSDAAADPGTLDLDHHLLAAVQRGVVHLGDRGRRERLLVETLEQFGGLFAEFLDEELVHLIGVGRWHPVEQAAELAAQRLTEGPRARRDDLAELDVGGAQVRERLRHLLDDLLLQGSAPEHVGSDADPGAGDLPSGGADTSGFDGQRHPAQPGDLTVLGFRRRSAHS